VTRIPDLVKALFVHFTLPQFLLASQISVKRARFDADGRRAIEEANGCLLLRTIRLIISAY
jgi:hypothetical protein